MQRKFTEIQLTVEEKASARQKGADGALLPIASDKFSSSENVQLIDKEFFSKKFTNLLN